MNNRENNEYEIDAFTDEPIEDNRKLMTKRNRWIPIMVLSCFLVLLIVFSFNPEKISYGMVHKDVISDGCIRLVFYLENNTRKPIKKGTTYDIVVNQFDGEFELGIDLEPKVKSKGIILVFDMLDKQKYNNLLNTDLENIHFVMKEKQ